MSPSVWTPIVGVVGVVIGVLLTAWLGRGAARGESDRQHERWVRDQRLEVYARVGVALDDLHLRERAALRVRRRGDEGPPDNVLGTAGEDHWGENLRRDLRDTEGRRLESRRAFALELAGIDLLGPDAVVSALAAATAVVAGPNDAYGTARDALTAAMRDALGILR